MAFDNQEHVGTGLMPGASGRLVEPLIGFKEFSAAVLFEKILGEVVGIGKVADRVKCAGRIGEEFAG